ncbi:MAG TPA: NIPSNAP family protein [Bryobacteraceae bacterium]|nr:NIPSNAP family protein [Bryobacteraceae bacterium]
MTRRKSLLAVPAAAASMPAAGRAPSILELRYFQLRNGPDAQPQRTADFLRQSFMPALARAGGKVHGVFSNLIAPNGPFLLVLSSFPSLAAMEAATEKRSADKLYQQELAAAEGKGGLRYMRFETTLLRAFQTMPEVESSEPEAGKPARVFELRTYESNSPISLRRKIAMFEKDGEIAIFRRVGLLPVFFGEAIAGRNMPNLTYMVVTDSLAAREKAWAAFGADPEWQKLRIQPGLSDPELVSNISNTLLRPLPFSPLR